ncbi:MAG: hypothetical protein LC687_05920 [Actinobacteria bacterium]|nr:hypothetical protein [Actinomycetota bacterium]
MLTLAVAPASASAQLESVRDGINKTGDDLNKGDAEGQVDSLVATIIDILSLIIGIIAVIMIIVGGLKYILSSGDASNVTSAKNTILYAIVGLVIVAFAQAIVAFAIDTADPEPQNQQNQQTPTNAN